MTLVIGTIKDITGVVDNTAWTFSSILRENNAGTQLVTTKRVVAKPVAGALSVAVEPGIVIVGYKGTEYTVSVPNQTSIDIWDLISIQVPLPSSAVTAFGNGLANAVDAADARTKLGLSAGSASSFATLELGGTTDTTLSRSAAGKLSVEGIDVVLLSGAQTLTGKTLTSPVVNTPTGIAKGDVGLGLVDNTSDATKNAAAVALTNKTAITAAGIVTGTQLASTIATGTAPLTVTSTTMVTNLNANLLNGIGQTTAATASTIAARDASANLTANALVSTVATGTAPFTVTSTTVVPNLNASTVAAYGPSQAAGATTLAARDGNANVSARGFLPSFTTQAAAAATTTLTIASSSVQEFTGAAIQTAVLPTTSVVAGASYTIINNSSGAVTVQSSALATIGAALTIGTSAQFIALIATPTTAANWHRR